MNPIQQNRSSVVTVLGSVALGSAGHKSASGTVSQVSVSC